MTRRKDENGSQGKFCTFDETMALLGIRIATDSINRYKQTGHKLIVDSRKKPML